MDNSDIFRGLGVEVTLKQRDDFLKVRETLTRIGIASRKDKVLYQSCHILHKQGRYVIIHFKELFILDGKQSDFSEEDKARRNTIASLLAQWSLVTLVNPESVSEPKAPLNRIKILPFSDKSEWKMVSKYSIGKNRNLNKVKNDAVVSEGAAYSKDVY